MTRDQMRFEAALSLLQGFASTGHFQFAVTQAVNLADKLLAELDRTKPKCEDKEPDDMKFEEPKMLCTHRFKTQFIGSNSESIWVKCDVCGMQL